MIFSSGKLAFNFNYDIDDILYQNRYSCQQEMIEIDKLKKDLTDIKYDALTRSSELMEKSRQSRIGNIYLRSKANYRQLLILLI